MYLARKGNVQFHVQDGDIEKYADNGYTILKETFVEVDDVAAEAAAAESAQMDSSDATIGEG